LAAREVCRERKGRRDFFTSAARESAFNQAHEEHAAYPLAICFPREERREHPSSPANNPTLQSRAVKEMHHGSSIREETGQAIRNPRTAGQKSHGG
jgi:hypothetical protein